MGRRSVAGSGAPAHAQGSERTRRGQGQNHVLPFLMPLRSGLVQDAGSVKSGSGLIGARWDHGEGMKAWGALLVKARPSTCEETTWPHRPSN